MEEKNIFIQCDGLVKIYSSLDVEVMALQGLDLGIKRKEMVAIIGKSGSGKSTLLKMLSGEERPSAGKLYVAGEDLFAKSNQELLQYRRHRIGFVGQMGTRNLLSYLTALENVRMPLLCDKAYAGNYKKCRERARELLTLVGLGSKTNAYPGQLSGGENQRLAIAVALALKPEILLADEPTGAVDTKTSDQIQQLFRKLRDQLGLTIIIVTHDMRLASQVDRVLMIADGKISTEKVLKESYQKTKNQVLQGGDFFAGTHEEYSILDQAGRLKLEDSVLMAAGIEGKRVRVEVRGDEIVIRKR